MVKLLLLRCLWSKINETLKILIIKMNTLNFDEVMYAHVWQSVLRPQIQNVFSTYLNAINFPEKISILNLHSLAFFTWIWFQVPLFWEVEKQINQMVHETKAIQLIPMPFPDIEIKEIFLWGFVLRKAVCSIKAPNTLGMLLIQSFIAWWRHFAKMQFCKCSCIRRW